MTPNEKRAFWKKHVEAWRQTKLSKRAYCLQNELSLVRFTYWVRQLTAKANSSAKFIPVPVRLQLPQTTVRLRLQGGVELEVPVSALEGVLPIVARVAQGAA